MRWTMVGDKMTSMIPPIDIAFSSYAIIGLTLLIMTASIAFYLWRLEAKTRATWSLIAFFSLVALSGVATILTNAFLLWNSLFNPWQDFFIIAGSIAMADFAYSIGDDERSLEARIVLVVMCILTLLALAYAIFFDYLFLFRWMPDLNVNDLFFLLLPLATLLILIIFLRRSVQLSRRSSLDTVHQSAGNIWHLLVHPQGEKAKTLRNLALALSLAFLPGLQTVLGFPSPFGFILSNIGSLLAVITISLVYLNYAPEVDSFMAKLVGITLATVLLIFSVFGVVDVYLADRDHIDDLWQITARIAQAQIQTEDLITAPRQVAYVVSWDAANPKDATAYRQLYLADEGRDFDLALLLENNGDGNISGWGRQKIGVLPELSNNAWWSMQRHVLDSLRNSQEEYLGLIFIDDALAYEIGFSETDIKTYLSPIVIEWLLIIVVSSALVLLLFPRFFRRILVKPLDDLLRGVRQVNSGELDTAVPVTFHDEIGYLTGSFNDLTQSLKQAQARQAQLFEELKTSYGELEERVSERTQELAAFTDLTMLTGDQPHVFEILQPALDRITQLDLCEALAVHLLSDDQTTLDLVGHRLLADENAEEMRHIRLSHDFSAIITRVDEPLVIPPQRNRHSLPDGLYIVHYPTYLGCSLLAGEQSHGWLSCYRVAGNAFTMGEITLLVALARQIGVIIQNHQLRQSSKKTAASVERQRLGRDLHDSVTQLLYSMTLFARSAKEAVEDDDQQRLERSLDRLGETGQQALREMRFMLFELQSPSLVEAGLAQALNSRLDMVERRIGTQVNCSIDDTLFLDEQTRTELYYVAIEAMNNAFSHGNGDRLDLSIFQDGHYGYLIVADNGRGFDIDNVSYGMGLNSMQQRVEGLGGRLTIASEINGGTKIMAEVPLPEQVPQARVI
ncbi:MAG TPA: hypothetical protein DEP47_14890 [Chloroflexi bacterium]|nr:hypothetical protein [Chloroflexota bacterium]